MEQKLQVDDEMTKLKNERGQTGSGDEGMGRRSEVKQKGAGRGEDGKKSLAIDEKYEAKKISGFSLDLSRPLTSCYFYLESFILALLSFYPSSFNPSSIYPSLYFL